MARPSWRRRHFLDPAFGEGAVVFRDDSFFISFLIHDGLGRFRFFPGLVFLACLK
jgi:hypothetical protein